MWSKVCVFIPKRTQNLGQQGEKNCPRKIYARKPFLRANQVHFLASTEDLSPFEASVSREILFLAAAAFIGLWQLRAELVSKVFDKTRLCGIARRFFVDWLLRCFVASLRQQHIFGQSYHWKCRTSNSTLTYLFQRNGTPSQQYIITLHRILICTLL